MVGCANVIPFSWKLMGLRGTKKDAIIRATDQPRCLLCNVRTYAWAEYEYFLKQSEVSGAQDAVEQN